MPSFFLPQDSFNPDKSAKHSPISSEDAAETNLRSVYSQSNVVPFDLGLNDFALPRASDFLLETTSAQYNFEVSNALQKRYLVDNLEEPWEHSLGASVAKKERSKARKQRHSISPDFISPNRRVLKLTPKIDRNYFFHK